MKQKIIEANGFVLRPPRAEDAASIAKHINDEEIARNTLAIPYPYSLEDANSWLEGAIEAWEKKVPEKLNFLIEIDGEAVGAIGLENINSEHKAELGYWLSRKYWGKQIMSKAIKELCRFGFKDLKLTRITAKVFCFNMVSKRVLEKNGFIEEGLLRKEAKKGEEFIDAYLLAKIKN